MICPRCGFDNLEGLDRCADCMEPLRDRDVPQPTEGLQRLLMEEPVSTLGNSQPTIISPDASVAEAARQMKKTRVGCVLIATGEKLEGIFTERDLLLGFAGTDKNLEELKVSNWMTRAPETVEATDSLRIALNKMSIGGFRHIPITTEGRVTGIVTAKDALKFLAREEPASEGDSKE